MKKAWFLMLIVVMGTIISLTYKINVVSHHLSGDLTSEQSKKSYFIELPITSWTKTLYPCPCIDIRVENLTVSSQIDLGFSSLVSFDEKILSQISDKINLEPKKTYGFNGKIFEKKVFEIPFMWMSGVKISDPVVQQNVSEFHENSRVFKETEEPTEDRMGTIGWQMFEHLNVMLDTNNQKVVVCDSFDRLKEAGYKIDAFTKTPLFYDRGFVEIDIKTSTGIKRCILDTGCTTNMLNDSSLIGQTKFDSDNCTTFPDFYISHMNFGPVDFLHLPLGIPFQVDLILGMDFFSKNVVFLDFKNNMAYFAPSVKETAI